MATDPPLRIPISRNPEQLVRIALLICFCLLPQALSLAFSPYSQFVSRAGYEAPASRPRALRGIRQEAVRHEESRKIRNCPDNRNKSFL